MKKAAIASALLLSLAGFSSYGTASQIEPHLPGATTAEVAARVPIHWVSVEQIKKSLSDKGPMIVGFDIDDT